MNDAWEKTMHRGMMDGGFTAHSVLKFKHDILHLFPLVSYFKKSDNQSVRVACFLNTQMCYLISEQKMPIKVEQTHITYI
jgi:hypothetical protein